MTLPRIIQVDRPCPANALRLDQGVLPCVDSMMARGMRVDILHLRHVGRLVDRRLAEIEGEIESCLSPLPVPLLTSPQQIAELLFEQLRVQGDADVPRTPKGRYSTEERFVLQFRENHPFIPLLFDHREVAKLKSTYVESLINSADHEDTIYTDINVALARTGRFSSSNPNLQNIPRPTGSSDPWPPDWGKLLRNAFVARPGYLLTSCDLSQIELRVLAHLSGDKEFIGAYRQKDADLHTLTASRIFSVRPENVTKTQRDAAKTINFAIAYGITPQGLQLRLLENGVGFFTLDRCSQLIQLFLHEAYPGVGLYLDNQYARVKRFGASWTMFGRVRWIPEAKSPVEYRRAAALRQAGNHPIQGSAGDILKNGFIRVWPHVEEWGEEWHLLLQVHDEGISEVVKEYAEDQVAVFKWALEGAAEMLVPIKASGDIAERWGDLK